MMLSDVAVRRPVFAAVAAIVLCVIGLAAFFFLPVRELPDVDPPIVSVNTSYAGASAEVNTGFDPGSALRACPEFGCHAPMASTALEAKTCGVSLVGVFTMVTSSGFMPFCSRPVSSGPL